MTYRHTRCQPTKAPAICPRVASTGSLTAGSETRCRAGRIGSRTCRSRPGRSGSCGTRQRNWQRCRSCLEPTYQSSAEDYSSTEPRSYGIPPLCCNSHLGHAFRTVCEIARVQATRRIMVVPKHNRCGVEVKICRRQRLLPSLQRRHRMVAELVCEPANWV